MLEFVTLEVLCEEKVRTRMIIGIGTDIASVDRIGKLLESRQAGAFLRRVMTDIERDRADSIGSPARRAEHVAGRWAAKEAVSKALGCGIGEVVGFHDMVVLPDAAGRPLCTLAPAAWVRLGMDAQDPPVIHVSITHSDGLAAAFAVVERPWT